MPKSKRPHSLEDFFFQVRREVGDKLDRDDLRYLKERYEYSGTERDMLRYLAVKHILEEDGSLV